MFLQQLFSNYSTTTRVLLAIVHEIVNDTRVILE